MKPFSIAWSLLWAKIVLFSIAGAGWVCAGEDSLNFDEVIGLTVNVQDSGNCGGPNYSPQTVTNSAKITGGQKGCPIKLAITVTGLVETQDAPFDYVYVNDVLFFSRRYPKHRVDVVASAIS